MKLLAKHSLWGTMASNWNATHCHGSCWLCLWN